MLIVDMTSFICVYHFIYVWWLDILGICFSILIKLSRDAVENPDPKPKSCQTFSICHWNVNSPYAHNFSKVLLLRVYHSIHKCETLPNSDTAYDDENLMIEGYNIVRSEHSPNSGRGGVGLYYKNSLVLKILHIKCFQECIVFQVLIWKKLSNFISLYQSPSQTNHVFDQFSDNLELTLDEVANRNPFLIVVLGDFNLKSENW